MTCNAHNWKPILIPLADGYINWLGCDCSYVYEGSIEIVNEILEAKCSHQF